MSGRSLLLVLDAPLQSWGARPPIATRDTEPTPTLSGVLGMIANAMGHEREDPLPDFTGVDMWVRTDVPGTLTADFHTAGGGTWGRERLPYGAARFHHGATEIAEHAVISRRHYLTGAVFLVVVHGPAAIIDASAAALARPVRPVFLGRKRCLPNRPVLLDVCDADPAALLADTPWQAGVWTQRQHLTRAVGDGQPLTLETVLPSDATDFLAVARDDLPLSWRSLDRRYRVRYIVHGTTPLTAAMTHPDARALHPDARLAGAAVPAAVSAVPVEEH
jgi:CRISPR system Cascade subunit CasD